ncbi:hypothetical protein C4544_05165 [candidate division WS5 bacterium]|uniref:Uncharacterized protein n=1 Tax=candidate division WS5 bacterium TaxID=2093353 RepID=A0A419DB75_9BACT|nr:MAG: hypothetical protein C4544_05165 [candidate division WS5 bacterium]
MKLNLNISERLQALNILNDFKGSLEHLGIILEDIRKFTITAAEWEKAERVITETSWSWNDEKGGEKEIEIQLATKEYLKKTIKDKDEKKEIGLQEKALISLYKKLA